ncbi:SPFH domain-containing protein [Flavobacterium sp. SUN046]|uniref:SPFH domain-containing protein n=1 Tax=Flavobacterium sp. SUN046 TaxID=3002440 RepID=UPI002DB6B9D8|nr:SPFH domain-containing protein [Flavobacterium sp. SUN046]MEC4051142.1 SPFH domain-containing protein [Flavobacterium sp. SUN046]
MNQIKDFFEYIFNAIKIWIIVQPWEQGIRVRKGKKIKKLEGGMYFRIPYLDSVYIQECRLRMVQVCLQTLTSKDLKTITINSALGYSIVDIEKLYQTLYHPEGTLTNIAMSEVSDFIYNNNIDNITPLKIEEAVLKKLNISDYGLKFEYFKVTNFASVRTFRIIQDGQSWVDNGLKLDNKK